MTSRRSKLPEQVRDAVLDACLHDHEVRYYLHACVVMPDHVHLLLTPLRDPAGHTYGLREVIGSIKSVSAHAVNRRLGRKGAVWQQEWFDTLLRAGESMQRKAEYISDNPVKAGLARNRAEYPWRWPRRDSGE